MLTRYLFIKRIFVSNFFKLKSPYKLAFALTYKCNLKCKTCFIWKKEPKAELSISDIESFFRKSNKFSWLDFSGGEVFLREDLLEISNIALSHCRSLSVLHFATNGQLTEKIINISKAIRRNRKNIILVISISMDGPEEQNNEIRGDKNAWANSLRTFSELKKLGFKFVYLGYTLSKFNSGNLDDMLLAVRKQYHDIDYSDIHINIAHTSEHYFGNAPFDFTPSASSIKQINEFHKRKKASIKNLLERRYLELIPDYLSQRRMPLKCQALSATCFIDPYGDIYPCTIYNNKIANIREIDYDLHKLWNNKHVRAYEQEILDKKCNGCWTPCEAYPAILGSMLRIGRS